MGDKVKDCARVDPIRGMEKATRIVSYLERRGCQTVEGWEKVIQEGTCTDRQAVMGGPYSNLTVVNTSGGIRLRGGHKIEECCGLWVSLQRVRR